MSSVLGIDVSSHAIDLIQLDETSTAAEWTRLPLAGATSFDRLRQVADVMPSASWYDDTYLIAIERPKTRFMPSAAALFPIFGAVIAHLPATLPVWDVSPTDWRRGLGLKGNAKKDECAARVGEIIRPTIITTRYREIIEEWPQDAFDAYAVAFYARELNARGIALEEAREKQLQIA